MSEPSSDESTPGAEPRPKKRRWKLRVAVAAVPLLLALYAWQIEPGLGELSQHSVGAGTRTVRVLQITDVHIRGLGSNEQWVLDTVAEREPDLIVVTGDTVNTPFSDPERQAALEFLAQLKAPLGVFAVSGNHEEWSGPRAMSVYPEAGVALLDGKQVELLGGALTLTGLAKRGAHLERPTAGYDVVLCHYPSTLEQVAEAGHELVLAGHSHGGQVQLPLYGALHLPFECGGRAEGWFEQDDTRLYVCRGVGTSIVPIRFGCRPELSEFTIQLPE